MKKRERRYRRMTLFTKASIPVNAVMALAKFVLSAVSLNFFLFVNGLYNVGMGLAKFVALKGHYAVQPLLPPPVPVSGSQGGRPAEDRSDADAPQAAIDIWSHFGVFVGAVVTLSSLLYMLYCVRMFVSGSDFVYNKIVAIAIAAFTFGEIGISIRGIVVTRRDREPMIEAVKLTNLASALISLVLTQTAILSFTDVNDMSFYNGIAGMVFGGVAALIGAYIILRFSRLLQT